MYYDRAEGGSQKILVIDDSSLNRHVLGALLGSDHEVLLAKDGAQGLDQAGQHRPDLILLDVEMPGMDGYEVLNRLRADPRTRAIGIIFITGRNTPEDEERGLLNGASDYIAKPFHAPVVRARVAMHLRLARQHHLLEQMANVDGLTELANRRHFDRCVAEEWARARRYGQPLAVALLDVDFFKQYNDHYGHAMGDRVLQTVAGVLRASARRPGDLAARYGGEEFALLLPDTPLAHAAEVVQRTRAQIEALALPHLRSGVRPCITVSCGVAAGQAGTLPSIADLLRQADERLYEAKKLGRNLVMAG